MPRLEIHRNGRVLAYDVLEDELTVGRHTSNPVRIDDASIAGVHVRITRVEVSGGGQVFKLEDLAAGDREPVRINGVATGEHVLRDGDRIALGESVEIVFRGDGVGESTAPTSTAATPNVPPPTAPTPNVPPPTAPTPSAAVERSTPSPTRSDAPARSKTTRSGAKRKTAGGAAAKSAARDGRSAQRTSAASAEPKLPRPRRAGRGADEAGEDERGSDRRLKRRRGPAPWAIALLAAPSVLILVLLVMLYFKPKGPSVAELIELASTHVERRELERALGMLQMIDAREPTGSGTLREIDALRDRLNEAIAERANRLEIDRAAGWYAQILRFEKTYLHDRQGGRAQARELLREIDAWLAECREVCESTDRGRSLLADIEKIARSWSEVAAMSEPDTAEDAEFRVLRRTWRKPRHDREALELLALARASGAIDTARADELQSEIMREAVEGRDSRLQRIERMWERDQAERAIEELRELVDIALPLDLVGPADELLGRYESELAARGDEGDSDSADGGAPR